MQNKPGTGLKTGHYEEEILRAVKPSPPENYLRDSLYFSGGADFGPATTWLP
jgi:hypothetical protein